MTKQLECILLHRYCVQIWGFDESYFTYFRLSSPELTSPHLILCFKRLNILYHGENLEFVCRLRWNMDDLKGWWDLFCQGHLADDIYHFLIVGGGWGLSKEVASFNHVGRPCNLFMATAGNPIFSTLGFSATCWSHFMCHHKLWPSSVSHPFSSLNSSLGLTGGTFYQKIIILIFGLILQNFGFSRLLFLFSSLSLSYLLAFSELL